jgi:hypothetical protein
MANIGPTCSELKAGQVHGILKGARFAIYDTTDVDDKPLGEFEANAVEGCTSTLEPVSSLQQPASEISKLVYALQISAPDRKAPHVSIFLSPEDYVLCSVIQKEIKDKCVGVRIELVHDHSVLHDLVLLRENERYMFQIKDATCNSHGLRRIPSSFAAGSVTSVSSQSDISSICISAGHFYRFLRHSNRTRNSISSKVSIKAYLLHDDLPDWSDYEITGPIGDNLNNNGEMTVIASISVEQDDIVRHYGFNLINQWNKPLYVWIFAFEMNTLNIRKQLPFMLNVAYGVSTQVKSILPPLPRTSPSHLWVKKPALVLGTETEVYLLKRFQSALRTLSGSRTSNSSSPHNTWICRGLLRTLHFNL